MIRPAGYWGYTLSPSGDFTQQLEILRTKADTYAIRLQSPRLQPADIITFMQTTYIPAMGYVLPCMAVDEEALQQVQTTLLSSGASTPGAIQQNACSPPSRTGRYGWSGFTRFAH
jgi:hypothetical protein